MTEALAERPRRACGRPLSAGGGKSREHVIPDWMQRHFDLGKRRISYTPTESSDIAASMQLTPGAPDHLRRSHNYGSMLLGAVCKKCNNGWMSNIEGLAKTDLISLISGTPDTIAPYAVARSALKTAYIFTVATDPPVGRVPQRHMLHLRDAAGLPAGVSVFFRVDPEPEWWFSSSVTFVVEAGEVTATRMRDVGMRHYRNAYRYIFRLGRLTLMVHYWPSSVDPVGYDDRLIHPLATGVPLHVWDDSHPSFDEDHILHDLAIRSTVCRVSSRVRSHSDLCWCGSGLAVVERREVGLSCRSPAACRTAALVRSRRSTFARPAPRNVRSWAV